MSGSMEMPGVIKVIQVCAITNRVDTPWWGRYISVMKNVIKKAFDKRITNLEDLVYTLENNVEAIKNDTELSRRINRVAFKVSNSNGLW